MTLSAQSEMRRVAVTAYGVVSPLGRGCHETVAALRAGSNRVSAVTAFDVSKTRCKTGGFVPREWLDDFTRSRSLRRLHAASHMMLAAVDELAGGDAAFVPELAVIGTTSGGMSFGEAFFRIQGNGKRTPERAAWLANYMPQKAVLDALESRGWRCPSQVIANACASGSNAIGHAFQLVRAGAYNRVLCGGYDVISELVFAGFDSLQAATPERIRPFDRARSGLVLGEGAALLAVENYAHAERRGAPILGEITGYGISTDNHHLTQPHPSGIGPRLAMERALADAGLQPRDIDYVNAHGTATTFNDATEGSAIAAIFPDRSVPVSSTKSMMGHALGAAGAIEAVFSLLSIRVGFLPPNINVEEIDPTLPLDIVANVARPAPIRRVISNSFGFGGTNASIVVEAAT